MADLGASTWRHALDFLYGTAVVRAMGDPSRYDEARRRYYGSDPAGPRTGPGPAPEGPMRAAEVLDEFTRRLSGGLMNAPASPPVRLLHAAAAADVDHGRAARPDRQPGRRRLARRPVRGVRRGGGRPLAVRPRRLRRARLRAADQRRCDGQLHGHGARPRLAPRSATASAGAAPRQATSRTRVSTPATRPTSRSRGRSMSSGSRARRWSCSGRRRLPPARRPGGRRDRPRPRGRPDAVRDRRGRRLDQHRVRSMPSASSPTSPRRRTCGSTSMRPMAAARGCRLATGPRPGPRPGRLGDRRSAQVVLPGLRHRRVAGPRRPHLARSSAGAPRSTTAAARRRAAAPDYLRGAEPTTITTITPTSSTSTSSRSKGRGAGGPSSCG